MADPGAFEVEDFAVIGRTFEEYRRMFDLDAARIEGETVLDCPSGAGSFVATAHERGASVTGADVVYELPPAALARRCREDVEAVADQLPGKRDLFEWDYYGTVEERVRLLREAAEEFIADYAAGRAEGRYLAASLPRLPFVDDSFSLVLSAHFLFLYGDRLRYEFHLRSLRELARVAAEEVRVFPLVGLDTEPYDRLDEAVAALEADGYAVERRGVPFEFQKGATEMLVIAV